MVEPITTQYVDVQDEVPDPAVQLQSTREGVTVVLLNRPKRGNAIGSAEVAALTEAFVTLQGAEGVRVVFLRGAAGCFSIGSDPAQMREMLDMPEEDARLHALQLGQMLHALHAIPALTVALVDGPAVGIGAGLVAACDTGAATRAALFAFADARLGLSPGALTPFVVEALGARQARRLFAWGPQLRRRRGAPHRPGGRAGGGCRSARRRAGPAGHRGPGQRPLGRGGRQAPGGPRHRPPAGTLRAGGLRPPLCPAIVHRRCARRRPRPSWRSATPGWFT